MKKSIVKILAIGLLLGGAIAPATATDNGILPQVTTTQTAKAATSSNKDDQSQTISYKVLKSGSQSSSTAEKYFTKEATVTSNGDGTYKVTLTVNIPSYLGIKVGVNVKTMGDYDVTDTTPSGDTATKEFSFNINKLSDLDKTLSSNMEIKPGFMDMNVKADFVFNTDSLKEVDPSTKGDEEDNSDSNNGQLLDPSQVLPGNTTGTEDNSANNSESNVVVGAPVTTNSSNKSEPTEQDIPYQVLKADPSQGESVSTQFFTGTAKVTKNDDGTYKVTMTMTYPSSFGTQPVTINSINGGSINADDTKTYSQGDKNFMDFSFNVNSLDALNSLIPCVMSIDVSNLGFNSDESVNFKFNATSSAVAGTSTATNGVNGTNGGTYGSASDWPTSASSLTPSASSATPSTSTDTLPQTGNAQNSIVLTAIGLAVAVMGVVLVKKTDAFRS